MHPENKNFLIALINSCIVSVANNDGIIMYHMYVPDGRPLSICAEYEKIDTQSYLVSYSVILDQDILESAQVDTRDKQIDPVAKDIIEMMRMCSTKIMMQEAHLTHSKFMLHEVTNKKTYS